MGHINNYHSQMKKFINGRFNGVSTKYLNNYIVWHNFINWAKGSSEEKREIFTTFVFSFISISRIAFREYFKRSVKEYFLNNLLYLVFTLLIAILTYCLCESVIHEGIKGLIVKLVICIFIPNLIYLLLYFMLPKYRKYIKQILNKLLRL